MTALFAYLHVLCKLAIFITIKKETLMDNKILLNKVVDILTKIKTKLSDSGVTFSSVMTGIQTLFSGVMTVLQTVWNISDYSDTPAIKHAKGEHNAAELRLVKRLCEAGHDGIIVGASGCALCSPCAIQQGEPCRFPKLQYSCMSAYCIFVRKLAESCVMDYDCGEGKLAFFGMYVFE